MIITRILGSLALLLAAQGARASDPPSVHGMLVVGRDRIILSHLPMFHRPHDYQGIFEATFAPNVAATYRQDRAEHPGEYYTLVPETFVLPEMVANPSPFRADLVRGHFERGGTTIAGPFEVRISRVIHFRKFVRGTAQPVSLQALLFRQGNEAFLAHFITAPPDYDQLVEVSNEEARVLAPADSQDEVLIDVPGRENARPLRGGERIQAVRARGTPPLPLTITREIYLEHGDLEH